MRRGPRPEKSKEAKPSVARKSGKATGARGRDLEESLAEALRDKAEAQEQQAATAEILRVIASSPTDLQFVFDTIVRTAARLCDAFDANLVLADGDELVQRAHHGPISAPVQNARFPLRGTVSGQAISEARIIHVADLAAATEYPLGSELAQRLGYRTTLIVPLVRDGRALGAIGMRRTEVKLFTERQIELLKTFAAQAVIAIENVRFLTELQSSNRDLTTALDKQTATSDILRIIAGSQTDAQPVFNAIVSSAVCLLGGYTSSLSRVIDNHVALVALTSSHDEADAALRARFPQPLDSREAHAQTIRARAPLNIADAVNDPRLPEVQQTSAYARGFRSLVLVPLIHQDAAIGAIGVSRREPGGFTGDEIALLQTFADQAVIAIENVRLFTELQQKNEALTEAHAQVTESLEQQTATSEILKVISSSPTDVQPVFDAIASSAAHLCATYDVFIRVLEGDGLRLVSHHGPIPASALIPVVRGNVSGRVVLERRTFHVDDIQGATDEFPEGATLGREFGHRTNLGVPLLREGVPLGAIVMRRAEVKSFTDKEIALLQTFADQAVIAIENVRLFKELEVRNRDLTEALDQQTATGEILRVISQSQSDAQPVFDTIIRSAVRLLGGFSGVITQIVGDQLQLAALTSTNPSGEAAQRALWPRQVQEDFSVHGQVITILAPRFVSDVELDPSVPPTEVAVARARGYRSIVGVPLLRDGRAVGSLAVTREAAGPFAESEIVLLQTFADQAAIAIENVRLFKELEARTQDLTRSVGELRALNEVGQAISSTLDLQAVLSTIVVRATNLLGTDAGVIYEYDEQRDIFLPRATALLEAEIVETMLATPVRKGEGATGRLAEVQEPIEVTDILTAPAESRVRGALVRADLAVRSIAGAHSSARAVAEARAAGARLRRAQ